MKWCPSCAHYVQAFNQDKAPGGAVFERCPRCKAVVPENYTRDYDRYPITAVSLAGFTQQGKSVFLAALLGELNKRQGRWRNYYSTPINGEDWKALQEKRDLLDRGELPKPTVFDKPLLLQLEDVPKPKLSRSRLLFYDASGAAFLAGEGFEKKAQYVLQTGVVILLVDLGDQSQLKNLPLFLINYTTALARRNIKPKERTILVMLTKGDMLKGTPDLPEQVVRFLDGEEDPEESADLWYELEKLSHHIERWMEKKLPQFVLMARKELKAVKYCIVSALGTEPSAPREPEQVGRLRISMTPRGVMVPLFWLWGIQWLAQVRMNGGAFWSLRWAVENADDGATLALDVGRQILSTPLVVEKSLRLVGAKGELTDGKYTFPSRIVSVAKGAVVRFTGMGRFALENLSIGQQKRAAADVPRDVVVAESGTVEFRGCHFHGAAWDASRKQAGAALKLGKHVAGAVVACHANDNGGFGILVQGEAHVLLENNSCRGNDLYGIAFTEASSGEVHGNTSTNNDIAGLLIEPTASPTVGKNTFEPNGNAKIDDRRPRGSVLQRVLGWLKP